MAPGPGLNETRCVALQTKQVAEYFQRLRRAGFEERIERSKFRDMMAQMALLQQDPALPA